MRAAVYNNNNNIHNMLVIYSSYTRGACEYVDSLTFFFSSRRRLHTEEFV